ncbi:two pore domain potassium channel family protein [Streptomyces lunaelactis]|uniref:potassium channel family protein n=1 Tax=Streptomyces lunaelactis TaxID=1535768 RepID=UPI001585B1FD|nr:potassium channel family protein [Streptomyces lunaelactis]NUL02718.1 two pore domain potassium channel family protein [Streptomyces lunaelactis]
MTADEDGARSRRHRRRLLFVSLLRSAVVVALLTALYYLLPLDSELGVGTVTALVLGLLAFGALVAWQTMAIIGSEHPPLRAIEALATAVPLFLLLFAAAYLLMAGEQTSSFNEQLSRTDALYFTVTVFATVGFGDIVPTSGPARVLTMVQMLMDLILVGLIAKVVFGAVQMGLERRRSAPGSAEREP